jgi:hypothetical protein
MLHRPTIFTLLETPRKVAESDDGTGIAQFDGFQGLRRSQRAGMIGT